MDGITFINSFKKVIIHPECPEIAKEFALYSYKVDRLSGDILPEVVDAHNHGVDGLRYSLAPLIKGKGVGSFGKLNSRSLQKNARGDKPRW
jgi:phage terminase large subunit